MRLGLSVLTTNALALPRRNVLKRSSLALSAIALGSSSTTASALETSAEMYARAACDRAACAHCSQRVVCARSQHPENRRRREILQ
jgi:hypothetical protein